MSSHDYGNSASLSPMTSPPDAEMPRLFTVREAAVMLHVSQSLVYHLIASHKLTCHHIGAKRGAIRICKEDLDEYLADCRSEKASATPRASVPRLRHIKL